MQFSRHVSLTGDALRRWFIAQCYDSLLVGALWLVGLWYLQIPLAPLWAILAAVVQFIPHFGPVLAVMGPALVALFAVGVERFFFVLLLYAAIIVVDGLLLQPLIMRREARVPIWASLTVPIFLGLLFGFWGLLLAAPLLAVAFAYWSHVRGKPESRPRRQTPPGEPITGGKLISPGGAEKQ